MGWLLLSLLMIPSPSIASGATRLDVSTAAEAATVRVTLMAARSADAVPSIALVLL